VRVSPLCLGTMMFGAWGIPTTATRSGRSTRCARRGHQLRRHGGCLFARRVGGDRRQGARRRPARQRRLGHQLHGTMATTRTSRATRALDHARGRVEPAPPRHRLDRPLPIHRPDSSCAIEETLSALTDLVRAGRSATSAARPSRRTRSSRRSGPRRNGDSSVSSASRPPYSLLVRGIEQDVLPVCERYGIGVIPWSPLAGGWLSGRYRKNAELPSTHRAKMIAARYDMSLPVNQAKLEAADRLAALAEEAGMCSSRWRSPSCSSTRP